MRNCWRRPWFWFLCLVLLMLTGRVWSTWRGVPVPVLVLREQPLVQEVVASGRIAVRERTRLGSDAAGVVQARFVREGDAVQAGELLLRLRDDEPQARLREAEAALAQLRTVRREQARAERREAEVAVAQAERELNRGRQLLAQNAVTRESVEQAQQTLDSARLKRDRARLAEQDLADEGPEARVLIERIAAAQAALARTEIRAPFDGVVVERLVEVGDAVQPGAQLFDIVRRQAVTEAVIAVDEKFLGRLAVGQSAQLIADAYPTQAFAAIVDRIAPAIDPQRGTVDVFLVPEADPGYLREDMTVTANIRSASLDAALALPNDLLRELRGDQAIVQLVRDGRVVDVPVRIGLRGLLASEIADGLSRGDMVLREPLASGQRVRPQLVDGATQ